LLLLAELFTHSGTKGHNWFRITTLNHYLCHTLKNYLHPFATGLEIYATLLFVNKDRVYEDVAYQPNFVAEVIVVDVRYPESFAWRLLSTITVKTYFSLL